MKICTLTTSYPRYDGDLESPFVGTFVKHLTKKGVHVNLVASGHVKAKPKEKKHNLNIRRFTYFYPRKYQNLSYTGGGGIAEQIKKSWLARLQIPLFALSFFFHSISAVKNSDLIHAHWAPSGVIGVILGKLFRKPLVVTIRENNVYIVTKNPLFRWVLKKADRVMINNEPYREAVLEAGINPNKVRKALNGVHESFFPRNKRECRKKLKLPLNKKIVLYVGSLIERKGSEQVLRAFEKAATKDAILVFVGDGLSLPKLKAFVSKHNLTKKVIFAGKKGFKEVPIWTNSADVFVFPTVADGIPNSLVEAMSCEVPVISTAICGIPEVVKDGKSGFLVSAQRDPNIIAKKLKLLLEDDKLRKKMSKAARQAIIDKNLTWDACADDLIKVYKELI